jgi:hypothetical protein
MVGVEEAPAEDDQAVAEDVAAKVAAAWTGSAGTTPPAVLGLGPQLGDVLAGDRLVRTEVHEPHPSDYSTHILLQY